MRVEPYTDKYHDDVCSLVENFYAEAIGEYDGAFDKDATSNTFRALYGNQGIAFILVIEGKAEGIIGGLQSVSFGGGKRIFQELIWYVNINHRRNGHLLLQALERHLQSEGFTSIIMAVMENSKTSKLKRLYSYLGYKPFETHFIKNL